MPIYRVERYFTYVQTVEIEAEDAGTAIDEIERGNGTEIGEPEYVDIDMLRGMSVGKLTRTELANTDYVGCSYVSGIKSVEEIS